MCINHSLCMEVKGKYFNLMWRVLSVLINEEDSYFTSLPNKVIDFLLSAHAIFCNVHTLMERYTG